MGCRQAIAGLHLAFPETSSICSSPFIEIVRISLASKSTRLQVHHADAAVVEGAEVVAEVLQIRGARPLRVVGDFLAVFDAAGGPLGNVELIQDVEGLQDSLLGRLNRQGTSWKRRPPERTVTAA